VTVRELLRTKIDRFRRELVRTDIDRTARALHIAELSLKAARVVPTISLGHERLYELTAAPKRFRGLRDLAVRVAGPDDLPALAALTGASPQRIRDRLARGDLAYVGELDGRMLAHGWFHRGPEPFSEDMPLFPRWGIPADTFWSYHAYTLPEARSSGVFVKVFQIALHELLTVRGAARVRCLVKASNIASVQLHERMGFHRLGTVVALCVPGARLVSWHDGDGAQHWVQRRGDTTVLPLPPGADGAP
jgi:GNAT superfamily N-acetyltransferase